LRQLVGGGMTDLFVANDRYGERVVIRTPKEEYARDRQLRTRFANCARVLRALDHPNIIKLREATHWRREPFLVLDYVEARTLRDLVVHRDNLLTENVLSLMRQMAAALAHIHQRGYLHLDFKPENILVQSDGHVVLIDFDLAIPRKPHPIKLKHLPGTPSYLAPETATQRLVDERSDVFSLGVTFYEMLTFNKPFKGATTELRRAAQFDPVTPPTPMTEHGRSVPDSLERLLLKCLAKAPDSRYPSVGLILRDLEHLL
jgi:serine/threonine-protein kinase